MDQLLKERLENQAFEATLVCTDGHGIELSNWISLVAEAVTGFIGYIEIDEFQKPIKIVLAIDDDEDNLGPAKNTGADIPSFVMKALNGKLSVMRDRQTAQALSSLIGMLQNKYNSRPVAECSLDGCGLALDFVRGRHSVCEQDALLAMTVHGKNVVGSAFDPSSRIVAIRPDGSCLLNDYSIVQFSRVPEYKLDPSEGDVILHEITSSQHSSPLASRIMRLRAGSLKGPEPTRMIISRGEDGSVMAGFEGEHPQGSLVVRFLPAAIQIVSDGEIVAQSGCDKVSTIVGWLERNKMEVCTLKDGTFSLAEANVEIRTLA